MAVTVVLRAYYGVTVTLADTAAHSLLDLLVAVDPSLAVLQQNVSGLAIQADDSNGSNAVYIGDLNVSSTRMAYNLLVHDQFDGEKVPLRDIYVRAAAATCKLNVQITIL